MSLEDHWQDWDSSPTVTATALPSVASMFELAVQHHQAGRLTEAEHLYWQIRTVDPSHSDSLHLLGMVAHQMGRHDRAVELIRKAIAIAPATALYHSNLGGVLQERGRPLDAVACYRAALALDPNFPDAHYNLGSALQRLGQWRDAAGCYRDAIALKPVFPEAYLNLGHMLKEHGHLEAAIGCFGKTIEFKPDLITAHLNLADALRDQGWLGAAIARYRKLAEVTPESPEIYNNLGAAHVRQRSLDEAVACFDKAINLRPASAEAHTNRAMALLAKGNFAAGWPEYEWRWRTPGMILDRREFTQPQWLGEPAAGKTLLIHAEQGFGDTLQFCRYAKLAAARGLRVIVEVPTALVRLLQGLPDVDLVLGEGEEPPHFDLHCPMLSLPLALGSTEAAIPCETSYLHADPDQVAGWRARLGGLPHQKIRIGIAWAANPRIRSPALATRSFEPERLAPLFDLPGVQFFSLQKDGPAPPPDFPLIDVMDEMDDFADTAALIANLDLVISVDTAVAHLAAALGRPTWLLGRFDPCWRWLEGRQDSPWYPSLRLYRQPRPGAWDAVLSDVAHDLARLAGVPAESAPAIGRVSVGADQ